jgi:hypothetical protein
MAADGDVVVPRRNKVSTFRSAIPLLTICLLTVRLKRSVPSKVDPVPMLRSRLSLSDLSINLAVGEFTPVTVRLPSSIDDFRVIVVPKGVSSLPIWSVELPTVNKLGSIRTDATVGTVWGLTTIRVPLV